MILLVPKGGIEVLQRFGILPPAPVEGSQRGVDPGVVGGQRLGLLQALAGMFEIRRVALDQAQRQVHQWAGASLGVELLDLLLEICGRLGAPGQVRQYQRICGIQVGADLAALLSGRQMLLGQAPRILATSVLSPAHRVGIGQITVRGGRRGVQLENLVCRFAGFLVRRVAVVAQLLGGFGQILLDVAISLRLPASEKKISPHRDRNEQQKKEEDALRSSLPVKLPSGDFHPSIEVPGGRRRRDAGRGPLASAVAPRGSSF